TSTEVRSLRRPASYGSQAERSDTAPKRRRMEMRKALRNKLRAAIEKNYTVASLVVMHATEHDVTVFSCHSQALRAVADIAAGLGISCVVDEDRARLSEGRLLL